MDALTLKASIEWLKEDVPQNTALKKANAVSSFSPLQFCLVDSPSHLVAAATITIQQSLTPYNLA